MDWLKKGAKNIWLPYTQMQNIPTQHPVKTAKDSYIYLENNKKLIDGIASWWSMSHGYQNPTLKRYIAKQLKQLSHVMLAGLANRPAYELATKLIEFINPEKQEFFSKVFFSDSGSTAVEVALKMSVQFHINQGNNKKSKFICFKNGYHGDTMGGMSMADMKSSMHAKFANYLPKQFVTSLPTNQNELEKFSRFVAKHQDQTAGLIIEPLVQCAGGMKFHDAKILEEILKIAAKHNILTIFDECATGFYRTGKKFAFYHLDNLAPDILVVGKALTGGMLTLAATITNNKIFDAFLDDSLDKALMHGPTFMGNPLACSAALGSLKLFQKHNYQSKVQKINNIFEEMLNDCANYRRVVEVRSIGAIAVIELDELSWEETLWMREEFFKHNIWLRPFANVIYVMPPLTISKKDLTSIFLAITKILNKFDNLSESKQVHKEFQTSYQQVPEE